ncbi:aquaporin-9-like protein [Leptotrombidium deliense]|uniref:Aquaporin-9-like protein n=1 Tax=Leptotrombidium deliense TaxID=299467 RepID=A0A443SFS4_9ACAR|nr:aquaporin-9-like protein [Leptotrombidium deliense]
MGFDDLIRVKNQLVRSCMSEFFGTLVLIFVAHSLGGSYSTVSMGLPSDPSAKLMGITFGVGLAAFVALSATMQVSGGHINPAITVAAALMGHFPWAHVVPYLVAQHLAGFIAGALLYLTHYDAIDMVLERYNGTEMGYKETAGFFGGGPAKHGSNMGCFVNSFFATAVFLIAAAACIDMKNMRAPKWYWSLGVALGLTVSLAAFAGSGGPSVNPAADLPCRLFAHIAGWGDVIWKPGNGHYWYLSGIIAPHLGAAFGFYFYRVLIGAHVPSENQEDAVDLTELKKLNKVDA